MAYRSLLRDLADQIEKTGQAHPCWSQVHQIIYVCTDHIKILARLEELNQQEGSRNARA